MTHQQDYFEPDRDDVRPRGLRGKLAGLLQLPGAMAGGLVRMSRVVFTRLFRFPRFVWWAVTTAIVDWFYARFVKALIHVLPALPAILAAVSVLGLVYLGWHHRTADYRVTSRYLDAGGLALGAERLEEAEMLFRKVISLDGMNPEGRYGLALTLDRKGNRAQARRLMQAIAPDDGAGYADAHFWRAVDLAQTEAGVQPDEIELFEHHLRQTLAGEAASAWTVQAHEMLGKLYLAQGKLARAANHIEAASESVPRLLIDLARIYAAQGNAPAKDTVLQKAVDEYLYLVDADSQNVEARLLLAQAQLLRGRMLEAEKALVNGLRVTGNERFAESLVKLYIGSFDRIHKSDEMELGELVKLLELAVQYGPNDANVANRLAMLAAKEGEEAERARALLKEVLASGIAPAVVHQILGTLASNLGNTGTALFHLEQAYQLEPKMLVVLNNLAWTLTKTDPPQLDRALSLANAAVELAPKNPNVRDTRGRILAELGSYKEALVDLESALPAMPENRHLHQVLADVYEQLGDEDLKKTHQRLADSNDQDESGSQ